ncbi:MAG: HD domain-containing protein [Patescibacteria group bacterium]|nr:HD domain-containing protein [Patescibacteria group bacterium]
MTLFIHHMALQTPVYRKNLAAFQMVSKADTVLFPFSNTEEFFTLQRAISLAHRAHKGEKRLDGKDYLSHPLAVMRALLDTEDALPFNAYITAILHDVLEHDPLLSGEICALFGAKVFEAVWALSRPFKTISQTLRDHENLYIEQMLRVQGKIPYVMLVKISDRLHNIQNLQNLPRKKREQCIWETQQLYLPAFKQCAVRCKDKEIAGAAFTLIDLLMKELRDLEVEKEQ